MNEKNITNGFLKTGLSKANKFRLPIVLWLIVITVSLLLITKGLTIFGIFQSIFMTLVVCFFYYFNIEFFNKKTFRLLTDLIKIGCLLFLTIFFGYWGLIYTVFFLVILIIDAFDYSNREFIVVFFMIVVAFILIWLLQNDPIYQNPVIKNTFFLIISNSVFALGVVSRTLAHETLKTKKQGENLERFEKYLKKENYKISTIFNNMDNAVISLDEKNNIYFANQSAMNMFENFRDNTAAKVATDKILLVDSSGRQVTLREIVESSSEKSYRSDLSIKTNDKIINYNALIVKTFDDKKNYLGAIVSLHSLTSDEILEKSKIEFSSLASHEIRTPLTVIEGYLYLMLINKDFVYNDLTKEYITMLHDSTTDLIKLANDILSMSKIDEGSVRVSIEKTDLDNLIREAISEQLKPAQLKGLSINYNSNKVPTIETDQIKIREILRNLIGNAIKFSIKGTITLHLDQEGQEITISVEDSGIGIPEESKAKLFNKFYQVENWETRKNGGSGLGLYVSKSLAKRIGGDLVLDQTTEKGSKFSLILPIKYPYPEDLKKHEEHELKEFMKGF